MESFPPYLGSEGTLPDVPLKKIIADSNPPYPARKLFSRFPNISNYNHSDPLSRNRASRSSTITQRSAQTPRAITSFDSCMMTTQNGSFLEFDPESNKFFGSFKFRSTMLREISTSKNHFQFASVHEIFLTTEPISSKIVWQLIPKKGRRLCCGSEAAARSAKSGSFRCNI